MRAPGRPARAVALAAALTLGAGCQLDHGVLYHCDDAGTPCQAGATCQADGFCHWDPAVTGCTPAAATAACQGAACGWADAGCGEVVDCRAWCPAGLECGVAAPNACGVPRLCTAQGWCWENPLPSGMGYQVMLALSPRQLWLGGEQGVAFFDGEKTRLEALPLAGLATVHGLAASSASDVYAVGTGGLVAHSDGTTWRLEDAGTSVTLRAVQATAGGGALAVGDQGVIRLRAAGTGAWSAPQGGAFSGQDFVALSTLPSGEAVLGSAQGLLVVRTGAASFARLESVPLAGVRALAAVGGRLYVAGPGPGRWLSRRDPDGGWTPLLEAPGAGAVEALAVDGEDLWLVGEGLLQRWAGAADAGPNLAPGTLDQAHLLAGAPVRRGELLAGGENGALAVAWADGGVALRSRGPTGAVTALCATPGALLAAAGCQGAGCLPAVLARASAAPGFRWSEVPLPGLGSARALTACVLERPARGWLTTDTSRALRWDGTGLVAEELGGLSGVYTGAWGQEDAGYWFVRQPAGKKGELVATPDFGAGSFTSALRGSGARAVWGVAPARWVGAVGDNGFWSELDPASGLWSVTVPPSTNAMRALHASALDGGAAWWVAAGDDALWTRQGPGAPAVDHLPGAQLGAAWTSSTGTGFAAGAEAGVGALLVRRDPGGGWTPVPLLLGRPVSALTGLEGPAGHTLWLGGDGGMLLRLETR